MTRFCCLGLALLLVPHAAPAQDAEASAPAVAGQVTQVTLYRGQAQVRRAIEVEADRGPVELVVGPLPGAVVPDSLFAEAGEGVEVRAVRHRRRPAGAAPREHVRELDEQLAEIDQQLQRIERRLEVIERNGQSLDRVDQLLGPAALQHVAQGRMQLDAETVTGLTTFAFEQREHLAEVRLELDQQRDELQAQRQRLQRERQQVAGRSDQGRWLDEAVLFLDNVGGDAGTVTLTYLVNDCGWSPTYTVRADAAASSARVEFNALIRQLSGEDWDGVELTLSTATPALSAAAPALAAFHVGLAPRASQAPEFDLSEALSNTNAGGYGKAQQLRQQAAEFNRASARFDDNLDSSWAMNVAGNDLQLLEQLLPPEALQRLRLTTPDAGDAPSLTYRLGAPISLASRKDQQLVRVAALELPADFHHVAMPVLSPYVYREAELTNTSDTDLLGGPVSAYLAGRFVGRTEVPTVARGQTLVVGFGADPQLRTEKRLLHRSGDVQGGNRVVELHYELRLENFKDQPVTVRLKDRLPHARGENDLRVNLQDTSAELSDDPRYQELERPRGILRWDLDVPPSSPDAEALTVDYRYTIAFDKSLTLTNPLRTGGGGGGGGSLFGDEDGDTSGGAPGGDRGLREEFEALEKARRRQ
jgi:hypothetical protein